MIGGPMPMLNIVVPMAGAGSRFVKAGYKDPKPLIPILGEPMIRVAIENLRPSTPHRFIFICQRAHLEAFQLADKLKRWGGAGTIVADVRSLTEGAACTVLTMKEHIDTSAPLMIANCDQYIDVEIDDYLAAMARKDLDGMIMTLRSSDAKWSYAALDDKGHVTSVVEKKVISQHATVGVYNYARGANFVAAAERMIALNERVNNEFYVAPAYNQMIAAGKKIGVYGIGAEADGMHGLGTPEDLEQFLSSPVANRSVSFASQKLAS
jgi:dTDP-glucose pyrophosphorylase